MQLTPKPERVETGTTLVPGRSLPYLVISPLNLGRAAALTPPTSNRIGYLIPRIPRRNLLPPLTPLIILAIQSNILVLLSVDREKPSTDLRNPQPGRRIFGALEHITRTLVAPMTFTTWRCAARVPEATTETCLFIKWPTNADPLMPGPLITPIKLDPRPPLTTLLPKTNRILGKIGVKSGKN